LLVQAIEFISAIKKQDIGSSTPKAFYISAFYLRLSMKADPGQLS
jgi:hypothetical protein